MTPTRTPSSSAATSPYERIRDAALAGFARDGVKATSIRDVAAAAGVSAGLVQHYFPSKAALREAIDAHVTEVARAALELRPVEGDVIADISARLTALVAERFVELRYLGRGVAEGDEAALRVFATLTELCRGQLLKFQAEGRLREDLDLEWAALHTVLINLGTVIFEPGVSSQLGRGFRDAAEIERWQEATTALFVAGEIRPESRGS